MSIVNHTLKLVRDTAGMFLYAFINPDAGLNRIIMSKREQQITLLKRLAAASGTTYPTLLLTVHDGIVNQYGMTPDALLTSFLNAPPTVGETTGGGGSDFWDGLADILGNLGDLFNSIGDKNNQSVTQIQPTPGDWNNPYQRGLSLTDLLPYIVTGGIILFLVMGTNDNDNKTKKRKK